MDNDIKRLLKNVFALLILGGAGFGVYFLFFSGESNDLEIEDTPIHIESIRTIAEISTVSYTDEVVMDTVEYQNGPGDNYSLDDLLDLFKNDIPKDEYHFRKGMILMNTGIIYGQIDNYSESLKLLTEANDLLINAEPFYKAICYENLGNAYSNLKIYEEALSYFNKALDFYLKNDVEPMKM